MMTPGDKERFIRTKANEHLIGEDEKIMWSLHAVRKLRIEKLRKRVVEEALRECVVIENYETAGRPLPDCLVLGFVGEGPIHAVIAVDQDCDRIFVITVYRPDQRRWQDGWRRRKEDD